MPGVGVKAGFEGLEGLRRQLRAVKDPAFAANLAQVLGAASLKQLADEFREERNPYGVKWAPLKLRKGKILRDTGRMAASATIRPRPAGFELAITAAYSPTHQYGATIEPVRARSLAWRVRGSKKWYRAKRVRVPRRQMLPETDTGGMGPIWMKAFQEQADAFKRAHFSRRRRGKR